MKDVNARDFYAGMSDTLGVDCIGYSTVRKYLREESFSKSMPDTDFESKIDRGKFH
jgi:hypothetical protein